VQTRKIIISCTTTKNRLKYLYYSLISLKKQSLKADEVYINISRDPYMIDEGIKTLPAWFDEFDVSINWVENTGSYRKLLPLIENNLVNDEDLVVTVDDDVLYGENWLEELVLQSDNHSDAIVCARGRKMKKNIFGSWQNYSRWNLFIKETKGVDILPTGVAGVVYKKALIDINFLLDDKYKVLAATTDDLWFKMASYRKNTPVVVCPQINSQNIYLQHQLGLEQVNFNKKTTRLYKIYNNTLGSIVDWFGINRTKNDACWDAICEYSNQKD
jgi:hypothetical protein